MGIIDSIPTLIANIPKIIEAFVSVWRAFNWAELGSNVINWIGNGIQKLFNSIPNLIKNIGNSAFNLFKNINWRSLGTNLINLIKNGISGLMSSVVNALKNVGTSAFNAFKSISWRDLASGIINGIVSGLASGVNKVVEAAKNLAQSALNGAKRLLGIHSPSTEFSWIGKMADEGLAEGLISNTRVVSEAMDDVTSEMLNPINGNLLYDAGANGVATLNANDVTLEEKLNGILLILNDYLPQLSGQQVILDTGALVGELAAPMDESLGTIQRRKTR